jgi:YfiR/HmsC-like
MTRIMSNGLESETSMRVQTTQGIPEARSRWTLCTNHLVAGRIAAFLAFIMLSLSPSSLSAATSTEYKVKGLFLLRVASFVEWPKDASSTSFRVTIIGKDPFGKTLEKLRENKKIKGRKIVINRCKNIKELKPCHILFISESEKSRLEEIMKSVKGKNVLTVSDMDGFVEKGGMVQVLIIKKKLRWKINREPEKRENLKISSKLLSLAVKVLDKRSQSRE